MDWRSLEFLLVKRNRSYSGIDLEGFPIVRYMRYKTNERKICFIEVKRFVRLYNKKICEIGWRIITNQFDSFFYLR